LNAVAAPSATQATLSPPSAGQGGAGNQRRRPLLPRRRGPHDPIDLGELSASLAGDGSELAPGHHEIAVEYQGGMRAASSDQALLAHLPLSPLPLVSVRG
jgi:hypothetical protein